MVSLGKTRGDTSPATRSEQGGPHVPDYRFVNYHVSHELPRRGPDEALGRRARKSMPRRSGSRSRHAPQPGRGEGREGSGGKKSGEKKKNRRASEPAQKAFVRGGAYLSPGCQEERRRQARGEQGESSVSELVNEKGGEGQRNPARERRNESPQRGCREKPHTEPGSAVAPHHTPPEPSPLSGEEEDEEGALATAPAATAAALTGGGRVAWGGRGCESGFRRSSGRRDSRTEGEREIPAKKGKAFVRLLRERESEREKNMSSVKRPRGRPRKNTNGSNNHPRVLSPTMKSSSSSSSSTSSSSSSSSSSSEKRLQRKQLMEPLTEDKQEKANRIISEAIAKARERGEKNIPRVMSPESFPSSSEHRAHRGNKARPKEKASKKARIVTISKQTKQKPKIG
ncbi:hypothetical protein JZ751_018276 [Albula glossodonta]|uniref:Uncharacterized protein n=1 Tax=Albula glossodonta TaxID=121402 RepID=A0A8T2NNZ0_9TELE|nr:hypothetical protein JZ751_018276 [Albula glossodonta]